MIRQYLTNRYAAMRVEAKTQTFEHRKNGSDYSQRSALEALTAAIGKTLAVIKKVIIKLHIKIFFSIFTA